MQISERLSEEEIYSLQKADLSINEFCERFKGQKIIYLTSGGTSVPLQKKAVRFIENFSTGTRGSVLAQQILSQGYPLIFFYRDRTYIPFIHGLTTTSIALEKGDDKLNKLIEGKKQLAKYAQNLLLLPFFSIYHYLEGVQRAKKMLPQKSILILCAAVSDFIPKQISTHKIHTTSKFQLQLEGSPKILGKLTSDNHLCVSFKLETDPDKLQERMQGAINSYSVDMVIGNIWGDKNWIIMKFNAKTLGDHDDIQYHEKPQKGILKSVLQGWSLKFNNLKKEQKLMI